MASLSCFWSEIHFSWLLLGLLGGDAFFPNGEWGRSLQSIQWIHGAKALLNVSARYPAFKRLHFFPSVFVYSSQISFALWLCYPPQLLTNSLIFSHLLLYFTNLRCMSKLFHGIQHTNNHWSNTLMRLSLILIALQDLFLAKNVALLK